MIQYWRGKVGIYALFAVILAAWAAPALATPVASSTFDTDRENWNLTAGAAYGTAQMYQPTGGNPGGNIHSPDRTDGAELFVWTFEASNGTPFFGNMSAATGGTLDFDLNIFSVVGPTHQLEANPYDIFMQGSYQGGTSLYLSGLSTPLVGLWTHYSVPMSTGPWHVGSVNGPLATNAQIAGVLADVVDLRIRGNWTTLHEDTGLDNVMLQPVPEPASLALVLVGLAVARRRHRPLPA